MNEWMTRWMNGWLDEWMDDWVAVVPDILGVHIEFLSCPDPRD